MSVRGARGLAALLAVASTFLHVGALAAAEERWPTKPIRMVVPFPPGGGTDLVEVATGTDIVPVAYKGSAPIYPDLMGNRVQLFFDNPVASVPHIKAGKLKAIAVTLPTAQLPDTPTLEQAGLKGFAHGFWYGLVAPAGTPPAIVGRIHKEAAEYLHSATGKADYGAIAVEAIGSTPQQFAATIREDIARWGKLAKALNLQPQ